MEYMYTDKSSPKTVPVLADGHCGYRAISYVLHKNENHWKTIRSEMANSFLCMITTKKNQWETAIMDDQNFSNKLYESILYEEDEGLYVASEKYWFKVADCIAIASHTYKSIIILTADNNSLYSGVWIPQININPPLCIHWASINHFAACTELPKVLPPIYKECTSFLGPEHKNKINYMLSILKSTLG